MAQSDLIADAGHLAQPRPRLARAMPVDMRKGRSPDFPAFFVPAASSAYRLPVQVRSAVTTKKPFMARSNSTSRILKIMIFSDLRTFHQAGYCVCVATAEVPLRDCTGSRFHSLRHLIFGNSRALWWVVQRSVNAGDGFFVEIGKRKLAGFPPCANLGFRLPRAFLVQTSVSTQV